MKGGERALLPEIFFLVVVLLGISLFGYYGLMPRTTTSVTGATTPISTVAAARSVTGTSESERDTFANSSCPDTGAGVIELLVVSDSTGAPVTGESINAVNSLDCNGEQVVYLNNFTIGQGGWLTPVLPAQAQAFGWLNFTITYEGATYHLPTMYPVLGKDCVTLHVPSGEVSSVGFSAGVCP
jgi:hypothetical protein